jgi:transcriptional regulator GlxA family with amidase domain
MIQSSRVYDWSASTELENVRANRASSIQSLVERLTPLLQYLDAEYHNPDLGMAEMAGRMQISQRHLNSLFKQAFGSTPYQYLINLRIRKAKEFLANHRSCPIHQIAEMSGFRETSHFIATFRKHERQTPEQYRSMNITGKDDVNRTKI